MRLISGITSILLVMGAGFVSAQPLVKLAPSGVASSDNFARAISINGDYIFIGASGDNNATGTVYVYKRSGDDWIQQSNLYASVQTYNELFGYSVSISGNYAIIGAPTDGSGPGSAYIFKRVGSSWAQQESLRLDIPFCKNGDRFGSAVAIQGNYAFIGAPADNDSGRVYLATRRTIGEIETWLPLDTLKVDDGNNGDELGCAVAVSGLYAVVGARGDDDAGNNAGSAYVFEYVGGLHPWTLTPTRLFSQDPAADDRFGTSVSISSDYIMVGAPGAAGGQGYVNIFERSGSTWLPKSPVFASDGEDLGASVSIDGVLALTGAPADADQGAGSGSVYCFEWNGQRWVEFKARAADGSPGDSLGHTVAVSGNLAVIGAETAAYLYNEPYDDRRFAYMADNHVWSGSLDRWNKMLENMLNMSPPPEFVLCAGDLVSWGAGSSGANNYNALLGSSEMQNNGDSHYLVDSNHSIPIYFCPGNHDYRHFWHFFGPFSLDNYKAKIHSSTCYRVLVGQYAIISLDTGRDKAKDFNIFWPEGSGLSAASLNTMAAFLDSLDGDPHNGMDTSTYKKIVMMHHPHKNPLGKFKDDGEFVKFNDGFRNLCEKYGVDWVISGHLHKDHPRIFDLDGKSWNEGETKCIIAPAGKHGKYGWEKLGDKPAGSSPGSGDDDSGEAHVWADLTVRIKGIVEAYAEDQDGNKVGRDENGEPLLEIPGSLYDRDSIQVANQFLYIQTVLTDISVYRDTTLNLTFTAEALAEGPMTIEVTQGYDDGTTKTFSYEDIPMYYQEGVGGSIVTLDAPRSDMSYLMTIQDPAGTVRDILPVMEWFANDFDLFQDTFPENQTSVGTGRIDAAIDKAPPGSPTAEPGDSAVVLCRDPVGGLREPEPHSGYGSAVYCYISIRPPDQPGKMTPLELEDDSIRWPLVDSISCNGKTWYQFRCDTVFTSTDPYNPRSGPVEDQWCIDINDHVVTNGDTLEFFFGAEGNTHTTYWSQETGSTLLLDEACRAPMEMQVLPARGGAEGEILYVNNSGDWRIRRYYDTAFELMGIDQLVDRYDKRDPTALAGNGLGGRCRSVANQLIPNYRIIIWDAGDLRQGTICAGNLDNSNSIQAVHEFLADHNDPAGAGVYFSGSSISEEWDSLNYQPINDFIDAFIPHHLVTGDHSPLYGIIPLACTNGSVVFSLIDTVIAYAGSTVVDGFDLLKPKGSATLEMTYSGRDATGDGAVIAFDTTNTQGKRAAVVLSGFGLHHIRNDHLAAVPYRAYFLTDILSYFSNNSANPTAVEKTAGFTNSLAQNYPNPFNPITTIRYTIKEEADVSLKIYNVAGQLVRTLVNKKQKPRAEGFAVRWEGRNNSGEQVSTGVYFYRLTTRNFSQTRKMVIIH